MKKLKKTLCLLMCIAMFVSLLPVSSLAAEAEEPPEREEPVVEGAAAPETEAPETEAPETEAPETEAPETEAPETEVPEAEAPETEATETEAPEAEAPETEAPETEAPETEAPETEAPETEAPETEAPETEAPEEAEDEASPALSPVSATCEKNEEGQSISATLSLASVAEGAALRLSFAEAWRYAGLLPEGRAAALALSLALEGAEFPENATVTVKIQGLDLRALDADAGLIAVHSGVAEHLSLCIDPAENSFCFSASPFELLILTVPAVEVAEEEPAVEPAEEEPAVEVAEEEPAVEVAEEAAEALADGIIDGELHTCAFTLEDGVSNEQLYNEYVWRMFYPDEAQTEEKTRAVHVSETLSGGNLYVEQKLKRAILEIASGERSSTIVDVELYGTPYRAEELDIDLIIVTLGGDAACELYWVNYKFYQLYWTNTVGDGLRFMFPVDSSYQGDEPYTVNPAKVRSAKNAAANARAIVEKYSGCSDLDKLIAYRDEICALNVYNYDAADSSPLTVGVDPWHLVYVFDGDPETNVVCAGYSESFAYLCDQSVFRSALVNCICVCGYVRWLGGQAGRHMWNVVTMDDGKNYLVDITGCDGVWRDRCFLCYAVSGSYDSPDGYTLNNSDNYAYGYNFGLDAYSAEALTLATAPYPGLLPTITQQPADVTATEGSSATISLAAGGPSLSYQWQVSQNGSETWSDVDANICVGGQTPVLEVPATLSRSGLRFRCEVRSPWGTVYSDAATLTVLALKPTITKQPASVTASDGTFVTMSVTASGANLSYQWQVRTKDSQTWYNVNAKVYSGGQTPTLTIPAKLSRSGLRFRCKVTNAAGTVYSSGATLTVTTKPVITKQPASATAFDNTVTRMSVTASGKDLSYQWQVRTKDSQTWYNVNAKVYSGGQTPTLTIPAKLSRSGLQFRCKVSNAAGTVYSSGATLTVLALRPTITTQPTGVAAADGATVRMSVTASGANLSYQWQVRTTNSQTWYNVNANVYGGGQTPTLTIPAKLSRSGLQFRCKVTNAAGTAYSNGATLTVIPRPTITKQPADVTATDGATVTMSVAASGANLSYQWQVRTKNSQTWYNVNANVYSGGQTATLTIPAKLSRDGLQFRCKVSNISGPVYSGAATLTVAVLPLIITQPLTYRASVGASVCLSVEATGADSYRWYWRSGPNAAWEPSALSGADTATLTVPVTAELNGCQFRCALTNASGTVYSSSAALFATEAQCGSELHWTLDEAGCLTISGSGAMFDYSAQQNCPWKKYMVKEVCIEAGVTSIGDSAFYNCTSLSSVTIPAGVTSIGDSAFYNCTSLSSVAIPAGVTSIGDSAFYYCTSLSSVTIPAGVNAIGDYAFADCTSLSSVTIPESVTTIGDYAFFWCTSLSSVTIPAGVTSIGDGAFSGCTSLSSVTIPVGVTSIGDGAFSNCTSLSSVTIPESVTTIGDRAFYACTSLSSVTIPGSVTTIGINAFYNCTSLSSVTIPESVTTIGDYAFSNCDNLSAIQVDSENLNYASWDGVLFNKEKTLLIQCPSGKVGDYSIPAGVTTIGDSAFSWCTSLSSVTIPAGVTAIGGGAFSGCTSLSSVTIPESVTAIGYAAFCECTSLSSVTIPESVTTIGGSAFSSCTSLSSVTIPAGVTAIGDYVFYRCTSLSSVTIPAGVTSIGDYAFADCTSLSSVTIPAGVTAIGDFAFSNCTSLSSVTIPESVTAIGHAAFCECTSLSSVTIPTGVTTIGGSAFSNCTSLSSVTIPAGVTAIGDYVFHRCTSLSSVTIPAGVTAIGDYVFYCCTSLSSVTIPESVTAIGNSAFYGCFKLQNLNLPSSITVIGDHAFEHCETISSVTIPAGVTAIGDYVFCHCTSLSSVTIPESVTTIGDHAFSSCTSLSSVTIPDSVTTIGAYAFSSCTSLSSVTIPAGVTAIGNGAFYWCESLSSVTIPAGVTAIGDSAFYLCESLSDVYYLGTAEQWYSISISSRNSCLIQATLHCAS